MNRLYKIISDLCDGQGIKPGKMCADLGISRGNITDLKMDRIETLSTASLTKISDYFGVSVDYLLTGSDAKKAPVLTEKDERDIAKRMEALLEDLENGQGSLAFSGEALDDETRELLIKSLRNSMEVGKALAKKKYTPKKYRKE